MLKIRLRRMGTRNAPFYRVVVSDSKKFPTSTAIEELGYYDTRVKPAIIKIDHERVSHWVGNGAQLSKTIKELVERGNTNPEDAVAAPAEAALEKAAAEETAPVEAEPAAEASAEAAAE